MKASVSLVRFAESQRAGVGVDEARIGDESDAGVDRSFDRTYHLRISLGEVGGRDQQKLVGAGKGGLQGFGPVVIRLADLNALGGQVSRLRRVAHGGNDLVGRNAATEQGIHDEPPVAARRSSNGNHGVLSFKGVVQRGWTSSLSPEHTLVEERLDPCDLPVLDREVLRGEDAGDGMGVGVVHEERRLLVAERGNHRCSFEHAGELRFRFVQCGAAFDGAEWSFRDHVVCDDFHGRRMVEILPSVVIGQSDLECGASVIAHRVSPLLSG